MLAVSFVQVPAPAAWHKIFSMRKVHSSLQATVANPTNLFTPSIAFAKERLCEAVVAAPLQTPPASGDPRFRARLGHLPSRSQAYGLASGYHLSPKRMRRISTRSSLSWADALPNICAMIKKHSDAGAYAGIRPPRKVGFFHLPRDSDSRAPPGCFRGSVSPATSTSVGKWRPLALNAWCKEQSVRDGKYGHFADMGIAPRVLPRSDGVSR